MDRSTSKAISGTQVGRRSMLALAGLPLLLAGCGTVGTNPLTRGGRSASDIRVATYLTPSYKDLFPGIEMFVDTASKAEGVSVDLYDSGTLLNAAQTMPGLIQGVADVVVQTSSYVSTSYPILGVYELPFVNEGFEQIRRALAYDSPLSRLINETLRPRGLISLGSMTTTPEWLFTVDRPIEKPEDVRGLRIRTAGQVEGEMVKALGGSPVSMSSAELYEALERGTIDGMVSYMGTVISRDLQNVLRYGTEAHFGDYSVDAYANVDWYDALPSTTREALHNAGKMLTEKGTDHQVAVHEDKYRGIIENSGVELLRLDEQQIATFRKATTPVLEWWKQKVDDPELAEKALKLVRSA
ncbi:TRAP-type C4-dicarboxylate transport system, substrate-binding protein [Brevibacterium sandarakinum]|uniref:TRAP-type C4-dicarboxylate transport system, substrate-binding protein n=1 Tax=Brevibacterium sandarakinum TaxID=629680 RepID=A0A1H1TL80_BRESA|nr:TRAP transporter substrate-binding protein [Brevibacterium sandarakinum]SDS61013.1 TRAP-type C4-dicarboxylate transport system, substrate-binding protein [Brevibacterium sandarakinum]